MDVEYLLHEIRRQEKYAGQIKHIWELPARSAIWAEKELPLHPRVRALLSALNIKRLYSHQAEAIAAILAGENVCTVSGTASGKTLTYLVPIVDSLCRNSGQRALLIYPTKALAQDQLRKLRDFGAGDYFLADTYDGDTPPERRRHIKREAQVVLTNPDMLHVGILPYHYTWADFWRNLQFVVLDEVHVYRGVFGAHTANIIRRLRRLCAHYGSQPRFISCSATIGNPEELTTSLTGLPVRVVQANGAPQGRKFLVFWNPPIIEKATGRRRSGNLEAADLLAFFVRHNVRCLVFALARRQAELILHYARELLRQEGLEKRIMAYRGGYLPAERREIERQLFTGELLGVTATTALELGVDIGGLQAVILAGYPGTISSTWQQIGRAGRGPEDSLAVLIGLNGPLHQYIVNHPEYIVQGQAERAVIDPDNVFILAGHLMCAAYEQPLELPELPLFGALAPQILDILREEGYVLKRTRWHWIHPDLYPAGEINIRSTTGAGFEIYDNQKQALIGTMDGASAFRMLHEGAIYLHGGQTYLVRQLDVLAKKAFVEPVEANYYTQPLIVSEVRRLLEEESEKKERGALAWALSSVSVRSQVVGYQKIRQISEQILGSEPLALPPEEFETIGLWLLPQPPAMQLPAEETYDPAGALHAIEHILIMLLPLYVACDMHDVGGLSTPFHPDVAGPTICLYDGYPGGIGIMPAAFEVVAELLQAARETIASCSCMAGCPACIQQASCGNMNRPLDKEGALKLLNHWLEQMNA